MKKQKMTRKISLNKETIAKLGNEEMGSVKGGDFTTTTIDINATEVIGGCLLYPITTRIKTIPPIDEDKIKTKIYG